MVSHNHKYEQALELHIMNSHRSSPFLKAAFCTEACSRIAAYGKPMFYQYASHGRGAHWTRRRVWGLRRGRE